MTTTCKCLTYAKSQANINCVTFQYCVFIKLQSLVVSERNQIMKASVRFNDALEIKYKVPSCTIIISLLYTHFIYFVNIVVFNINVFAIMLLIIILYLIRTYSQVSNNPKWVQRHRSDLQLLRIREHLSSGENETLKYTQE